MSELPTIAELLPHTGRMLLLDQLLSGIENSATCRTTIGPDFVFLNDGRVDVVVSIELIAQTLGVCVGLASRRKGRPPRIGFLVGVREATFAIDAYLPGDVLEVVATHVWGEELLGNFRGHVKLLARSAAPQPDAIGTIVATCELSVYAGEPAGMGRLR